MSWSSSHAAGATGEVPADGQELLQRVRQIFTIADGKFAGYWCVTNVAGPTRQLTEEQVVAGAGT